MRSIGLQDAGIEALTDVMGSARILPVVNSLEVHPGHRNDALLAFCRSQVLHVPPITLLPTAASMHARPEAPGSSWRSQRLPKLANMQILLLLCCLYPVWTHARNGPTAGKDFCSPRSSPTMSRST